MYSEVRHANGIKREARILGVGDDLLVTSGNLEQYKGFTVAEIDPTRDSVAFTNGEAIKKGDVVGDISEADMRRIQIRETIASHKATLEKMFV